MANTAWTVLFYVDASGGNPVRTFLEGLDLRTQARLRRAVELLVERNTNTYRIVYAFSAGRRIVLLHGFQKKTRKTPRRELETAARRFEDFLARTEG